MKRLSIVLFALVPLLANAQAPQLQGRWRAVESRVQMTDGTSNRQLGTCTAEFTKDRSITECDLGEGRKNRVVARLYNVTAVSYEIEVIEAAAAPKSVGVKNKIDYKIEGNRLTVSAIPATSGTAALRIETTLVRE